MRMFVGVAALVLLSGCAQMPKVDWFRADAPRMAENPVLMQQAELDATSCLGERNNQPRPPSQWIRDHPPCETNSEPPVTTGQANSGPRN
jgi:hypothetical protein